MRHDRDASARVERFVTAGVDIGTRTVKLALLAHGSAPAVVLASEIVAVGECRGARDAQIAVKEGWGRALRSAGLTPGDVVLAASTGTQAYAPARVGHFYRRLSLTAGARFLFPGATAVLDVETAQIRCARLDKTVRGARYAATPTGATGGAEALQPAPAAYEDLGASAVTLMRGLAVGGPTAVTGALALEPGFVCVLARRLRDQHVNITLLASPDAIFAGAFGAALLAADRFQRALGSRRPRRATSEPRHRLGAGHLILN